jgi:acyl carrier protein
MSSDPQKDDPAYRAKVFEEVVKIVAETLNFKKDQISSITEDCNFVTDLGAESLDQVELVMEFESHFQIPIPDAEADAINTVRQAVNYIVAHSKQEA